MKTGAPLPRRDAARFVAGRGRYTDDMAPQTSLHALVLRSPHAHAKFTIDASRARTLPGVAAILVNGGASAFGERRSSFRTA